MSDLERFGSSLLMDAGDLVLEAGPGGTRFRAVEGLPNLMQAVELRVLTPFASDRFNTTYGLDYEQIFTHAAGLRMVKELIRLNLVRTIGTDRRVQDVREIVFVGDAQYMARHPEVTPAAAREERRRRLWRIEVVIDTRDAQALTVPLELTV
jgi:hypothetical protein